MRIKSILLMFVLVLLLTVTVMAQDSGVKILSDLFQSDNNQVETYFDQEFLDQVPADTVIEILNSYKGELGLLKEITGSKGDYILVFEKGNAPAKISLNNDNKIQGLWFGNWTLNDDKLSEIISEFKALEGTVSYSVIKNNKETILSYNEDKKLAVGSSFKLYVLKAVYDAVEEGMLAWDSVVKLNQDDKTLPSGIIQNWSDGTPLTIKTLTSLMISLSDNTATDILIDIVGREKIESYLTEENIPFLKTSELFRLKYAFDPATQEEYINADQNTKKDILDNSKDMNVNISMIITSPTLINEMEWFFSTSELSEIIYSLQDADELSINPGLVGKDKWYLVGYKGGSEPGVLQYTQVLQKEAGQDIYTVSVTANNPEKEVNINKVTELTTRLITLIGKGEL